MATDKKGFGFLFPKPNCIFILSRFFGVLPLGANFLPSKSWLVYSFLVLSMCFALCSFWSSHFLFLHVNEFDSFWGRRFTQLTRLNLPWICGYIHLLQIQSSSFNYCNVKHYKTTALLGILWIFAYPLSSPEMRWESLVSISAQILSEITMFLLIIQFCSCLKNIEVQIPNDSIGKTDSEELAVVVIEILEMLKSLNSTFGPQLLLISVHCLVEILLFSFNILWDITHGTFTPLLGPFSIINLSWQGFKMCFLTGRCDIVSKKVDLFNIELFRLMRASKDLCSNTKLHLYITMKPSISFTACGFFTLGYPLVTSVIAAATTYLVILVQFSMPK